MTPGLAIIIANALPLVGVVFWDWDLLQVLLVFWMESAVIGLFSLARIVRIQPVASVLLAPFFLLHYGGFMLAHLVFLFALFGQGTLALEDLPEQLRRTLLTPWAVLTAMGFLISHGASFVQEMLHNGGHETVERAMARPYRRIFAMHLALILGAFAVQAMGSHAAPLAILVVVKSLADLRAERRERQRMA